MNDMRFTDLLIHANPALANHWRTSAQDAWIMIEQGHQIRPLVKMLRWCYDLSLRQTFALLNDQIARDDMRLSVQLWNLPPFITTTLGDWLANNFLEPSEYRRVCLALRTAGDVAGGGGASVTWKLEKLS